VDEHHGGEDDPPTADIEAEKVPVPHGGDTPSMCTDHDGKNEPLEKSHHLMMPSPELAELPAGQVAQALHPTATAEPSTSRLTFSDLRRLHERLDTVPVRSVRNTKM
jgi:hypothetical protein